MGDDMKKLYPSIAAVLVCGILFVSSFEFVPRSSYSSADDVSAPLPTIIIDPGHGGFDGGTVTNDGFPEKTINLEISLEIKTILDFWGYSTVITRDDDVSLEDEGLDSIRKRKTSDIHNRMALMHETENSVFVSIHQNHYSVERYNGTQVFYSRNFSEQSSVLAQNIQESVVFYLQPENTRLIKECGSSVYLIYNAVRPAVLVECGFLSNEKESQLLRTDEYRRKIAYCIALGIQNYLIED